MRPLLFSSLFLLAACGASISGVWTVEVPSDTEEDPCSDDVSHNFDGAEVNDDEDTGAPSDIVVEESSESSPTLIVLVIEETNADNATLLFNNEIFPGTRAEDTWTFTWESSQKSSRTESVSGYTFTEDQNAVDTTTWELTATDDTLSGSLSGNSKLTREWTESDTWGEDAQGEIGERGQIPAGSFLTVTRDGNALPASNSFDREECSGNCELKVVSTCDGSLDVSGARTGYETEDLGDRVLGAGQE